MGNNKQETKKDKAPSELSKQEKLAFIKKQMQELESVGDIAIKAATQKYFGNQIEFDDVRQYRPFLFDTFRELINTSGPRGIFGAPSGHEFDKKLSLIKKYHEANAHNALRMLIINDRDFFRFLSKKQLTKLIKFLCDADLNQDHSKISPYLNNTLSQSIMLSTLFESNRFSQLFFGFTGPNDDWDRLNEDLFFEIIGIIIKSKSSYAINTTLEKIETHYNGELPSNLKLKVKNIIEECHINADELNLTEKARRQYYNILGIVDTENSNDNFSYSSF